MPIRQTVSAESVTLYVRLLPVKSHEARAFYEKETLRGGWTVRQLERQIGTQFYERTMLSKNKAAMFKKGGQTAFRRYRDPRGGDQGPLCLGVPGAER